MGFLYGSSKEFNYFFHRKSGIRRETLKEFLKELFEFDNYTHLCLENTALPKFLQAVDKSRDKIGLNVKSVKNIKSANFEFSYEVFNKEIAAEIESLFEKPHKGVNLKDYKPEEQIAKDAVGIEGYAPVHAYALKGSGITDGDFGGVMELYLNIKRCKESESIKTGEIILNLEDRS